MVSAKRSGNLSFLTDCVVIKLRVTSSLFFSERKIFVTKVTFGDKIFPYWTADLSGVQYR